MKKIEKPFIDFYGQIGFAPTGQEGGNSLKHSRNRTNLYRSLGLHQSIFSGARVLEIGPGSGENAIDLLSRGISSLKLLDAVPEVLNTFKERINSDIPISYEVNDASIPGSLSLLNTECFDLVICEGVIPFQLVPKDFLQNISASVAPGGILLITTADGISSLSEVLRRILAFSIIIRNQATFQDLEKFFSKDFESLKGMTRTSSNWLLDSIVNPWIGNLFSIEDALSALSEDFRPYSMSPNLHLDINWYKNILDNQKQKEAWIQSYKTTCQLLIDYRVDTRFFAVESQNSLLLELCAEIFTEMQEFFISGSLASISKVCNLVSTIIEKCSQLDAATLLALSGFVKFFESYDETSLVNFKPFWGRGQQYLCFERCDDFS